MGISRHIASVYSVPNLFRNGGLDFQDDASPLPAHYTINGALKNGGAADNRWAQVFGSVPASAGAPSNYFRVLLSKTEPVVIGQDMINPGFVLDHVVPTLSTSHQPFGYQATERRLLYQGEFTFSFMIRVMSGEIVVGFTWNNALAEDTSSPVYVELDSGYAGRAWRRFTGVFDAGARRLGVVAAQIQRKGRVPAVECHIGHFMLGKGGYDDLPYTGDQSALAFPKGAIIQVLGQACPPGFVKIDEDKVYPKQGTPGGTGGSLHHEHNVDQLMYPAEGWPRRSLLDNADIGDIPGLVSDSESKADPANDHEHTIEGDAGSNNTDPNWRAFTFCRRA